MQITGKNQISRQQSFKRVDFFGGKKDMQMLISEKFGLRARQALDTLERRHGDNPFFSAVVGIGEDGRTVVCKGISNHQSTTIEGSLRQAHTEEGVVALFKSLDTTLGRLLSRFKAKVPNASSTDFNHLQQAVSIAQKATIPACNGVSTAKRFPNFYKSREILTSTRP